MPFLTAALSLAFAGTSGFAARSLAGTPVLVADGGPPQVVVAADSACAPCLVRMREFERAGFDLVWVATDASADAALLRLRAHHADLASRAVADPDGQLARRLQLPPAGGIVVFDERGHEALRGPGLEADGERTLAAAVAAFPRDRALAGRE